MYEGRIVTEEDVPAIKTEMAGLNKIKDKLNTARRDIVSAIKSPVDAFDADVKAITDLVIKARAGLDEQVKEFERLDREGRRASIHEKLQDLDRAMAYLEGKRLEDVSVTICTALERTFKEHGKNSSGVLVESDYFELRPYKKGTCHFKFRDKKLWERFNLTAADGKNWLPDDVKARKKATRENNKRADRYGLHASA